MLDLHNSGAISEGIDVVLFKGFNVDRYILIMSLKQLLCGSSHILRNLWQINEPSNQVIRETRNLSVEKGAAFAPPYKQLLDLGKTLPNKGLPKET